MKRHIFIVMVSLCLFVIPGGTYPYRAEPVSRDFILERAHLFYRLRWYCTADNIYEDSVIEGARSPYAYGEQGGWKTTMPYCWAGHDDVYEFLKKMTAGKGAGDISSSSSRPYHSGMVGGVDCSGFVSQAWRSGRYTTSSFHRITDEVGWDNLAPGDAINHAGSHIRLVEEYPVADGGILVYEATRGGGAWSMMHHVLPYENSYLGIRYEHVSPRPSCISVRQNGPGTVNLQWLGDTGVSSDNPEFGFHIYQSSDLKEWSRIKALLPLHRQSVLIDNLDPGELYYFRVTAEKPEGESEPSNIFPVRITGQDSQQARALLIDGFDQYMVNHSASPHSLLSKYALALEAADIPFDTVDNVSVTLQTVDISQYDMLFWMLGDEDSANRTLNHIEQDLLRYYLEQGGNLFISGANIGRDLVHHAPDIDNLGALNVNERRCFSAFFKEYLKADFISVPEQIENKHKVMGVESSIFSGMEISFDDGTQGTYPVNNTDVIQHKGGSAACLQYTNGQAAAIQYKGTFGDSTQPSGLVYMAIPFESIYPQETANELLKKVVEFFVKNEM